MWPLKLLWWNSINTALADCLRGAEFLKRYVRHLGVCVQRLFNLPVTPLISLEMSQLLCKPKVYYRADRSQPPVPVMSQMNPVQTFQRISVRSVLI